MNGPNENGWHSLIFAVYGGHLEIVDFLLYETRVSLLKRDTRNHRTACDIAEQQHDLDILALFSEHQ